MSRSQLDPWIALLRRRILAGPALVAAAGVALVLGAPDGPGVGGSAAFLVATLGAALGACLAVAIRKPENRVAWGAIALGITCSAGGDLVTQWHGWTGLVAPDVAWDDLLHLASYLFLALGFSRLADERRRRGTDGADVDVLIDLLAIAVVAGFVVWQSFVSPTLDQASVAWTTRVVDVAYPIFDVVLLTLAIRAMAGGARGSWVTRLLATGVVCWLVADFSSLAADRLGASGIESWTDTGWMVGAVCLAMASWAPSLRVGPTDDEPEDEADAHRRQVAWTIIPLFAPGLVNLVTRYQGEDPDPGAVLVLTVALGGLVLARVLRLLEVTNVTRQELRDQERFWRTLAASSSDAVVVVDARGVVLHDSPTLHRLVGGPSGEAQGRELGDVIGARRPAALAELLRRAVAAPGQVVAEDLDLDPEHGGVRCLSVRAVNLVDDPTVAGVVVSLHDATERRDAAEALNRQAFHDSLTGLANRALFRDRLEHALTRSARTGLDPAVIFLDVDGFKKVNDSLGHEAGDDLLVVLAERIKRAVRSEDTVARLGGDEFAILIDGSAHPTDAAAAAAERIIDAFLAPVPVGDRMMTLSASLGIEVANGASDASLLLRNADIAMYRAKAAGRGRWVFYDPSMRAMALERLELELDLVAALDKGEFRLAYQPLVHLATGAVVGFEALLRWDHPVHGAMPPDSFVPVAEDTGLIVEVGAWVLDEACRTAARWQAQYAPADGLAISVNVSGVQMARPDLVHQVAGALERSRLAPEDLILEMTETALVNDSAAAAERLAELRSLGIRVAVDDFGTGYSSLSYLRQFPVDILKIDRSFVTGIGDGDGLPPLLRGLLDLGRTLDLEVVAEGIEEAAQFHRLRDGGCHLGQGFLFARPLSPADAEALLAGTSTVGGAAVPVPQG